jgi:hypothetical protein
MTSLVEGLGARQLSQRGCRGQLGRTSTSPKESSIDVTSEPQQHVTGARAATLPVTTLLSTSSHPGPAYRRFFFPKIASQLSL